MDEPPADRVGGTGFGMDMGQHVALTPDRWTPQGEAEGRYRGHPVRVWGGIPGERAEIKLVTPGERAHIASWQSAERPDPHRVTPRCDRYHVCGGCPIMHLDLAGQHAAQRSMVIDALRADGLDDVVVGEVEALAGGDEDYRQEIKLGVGWSEQGALRVGALGRRSRSIVPIPRCYVVAPILRFLMGTVAHHVRELDLRPYAPERDTGVLRAIMLRASRSSSEVLVTLIAGKRVKALDALAEAIASAAREVIGVQLHVNDTTGLGLFMRDPDGTIPVSLLSGRGWVEDTIDGISAHIGAEDLFPSNPAMAELVLRGTLDGLALRPDEPVLDLIAGVGTYALAASRVTGWVLGIEEVSGAVDAAREAARRNNISAEFLQGRAEALLSTLTARLGDARPVILANAGRKGLDADVGDAILALRPRRMAYLSSNPRAMAHDLRRLREVGLLKQGALYDIAN
ncbi:MAG TPA: 23S rRNA (uracil(1939)-C(5))-methyltransferase RlmD, partial [Myxococcota bacterium]|nr:23S rRNA (uracil(1939)-C(5))-methyltransferase RlmD [Myxococcota bacterium]